MSKTTKYLVDPLSVVVLVGVKLCSPDVATLPVRSTTLLPGASNCRTSDSTIDTEYGDCRGTSEADIDRDLCQGVTRYVASRSEFLCAG